MGAGDTIAIPDAIGLFHTVLTPIPIFDNVNSATPPGSTDGVIGCAIILQEQDGTQARAIAEGHAALCRQRCRWQPSAL